MHSHFKVDLTTTIFP